MENNMLWFVLGGVYLLSVVVGVWNYQYLKKIPGWFDENAELVGDSEKDYRSNLKWMIVTPISNSIMSSVLFYEIITGMHKKKDVKKEWLQ